jgi:LacI family transcriptional regulator
LQVMEELDFKRNLIASTLAYNRTFRIATLLPDYKGDPYWEQTKRGLDRAFETVQHYNIEWEAFFSQVDDPVDFLKKAKEMLRTAPDALLLAPVFLEESIWLLNRCREKQIPTVKINTNIEEDHSLCYVGQDSYQSGVLAGKLLKFFLRESEAVMVLNLDKKATIAQHLIDKERGIRDYFSMVFGDSLHVIKREFVDYDHPDRLRDFMVRILEAYPKLKGIFVTNSRSYKLLDCMDGSLPGNIYLVGFDLLEENLNYLREDRLSFLINQNPIQQGYRGIMNLYTHLVLKENVERIQYLPLDIVVTENVEYYLKRQEELHMIV